MENMKKNPYSRRHVVTMYNPFSQRFSLIPPCHNVMHVFNIYKKNDRNILDISTIFRSTDMILGMPFNMVFS